MHKLKVLLAIRPRMLSEVVRHAVARQTDMEVVGELSDPIGLPIALRTTKAKVLITTLGDWDAKPGLSPVLLAAYPQLNIIALSATGDAAYVYTAGKLRLLIDNMGEEAMLGAIRASMR